jgi:hypothetical protein
MCLRPTGLFVSNDKNPQPLSSARGGGMYGKERQRRNAIMFQYRAQDQSLNKELCSNTVNTWEGSTWSLPLSLVASHRLARSVTRAESLLHTSHQTPRRRMSHIVCGPFQGEMGRKWCTGGVVTGKFKGKLLHLGGSASLFPCHFREHLSKKDRCSFRRSASVH